jgi:pyruvate dehydrogenase E2 component (dihydrolipoamide acetyltransferase)
MIDVPMPRLSDTMEEGTILRWLKRDGEDVARGEELVEIETDKANMTYEADSDGVLRILAREGETLAVGQPIARIGEQGDDEHAPEPAPPSEQASHTASDATAAAQVATGGDAAPAAGDDRVKASPLARRVARETGVDLSSLAGSGPGGRIVKADVEASAGRGMETPQADMKAPAGDGMEAPAEAGAQAPTAAAVVEDTERTPPPITVSELASAKGETQIVELSRTQRTIARRMAESKATVPDFTLRCDVDMQACVELREELKRLSADEAPTAPTYNDMVVKACALALRDHPRANGSYRDGRFELHSRVNVGVAVAVNAQDPLRSALVVPTVFDADGKALGEIARETRALVGRVRDASITPPELSGGTFTVSNLGMFGIRDFTAIVNPPQAAILAVGALELRPVARKRKVSARHRMTLTLSCDHRILYGADAALFLARVRELLEEPAALTL